MYTVILVDDEKKIVESLEKNIPWNELGVGELYTFTNPLQCFEKLEAADILVTDIQMPELNGLDLIEQARKANPQIKVIVLSAFDDFIFVRSALKQGAEDYLLKPVNKERLVQLLESTTEQIQKERTQNILVRDDVDLFTHNFFNRWVTSSIGLSELSRRAEVIKFGLNQLEYLAVIVRSLYTSDVERRLNNAINILSLCKNVLADKCKVKYFCFNNHDLDTVILFNGSAISQEIDDLKYVTSICIKNINTKLQIDVYTCFGKIVEKYGNVHQSYSAAIDTFNYCMFLKPNKIMLNENLESFVENLSLESLINIEDINSYIEERNFEGYKAYLDKVFMELEKNKNITVADIQWLLISVLFCMSSFFVVNMHKLSFQNNIPMDIYKYKDINELKESLIGLYQSLLANSDVESMQADFSPIIKRALHYINANYTIDISLGMVAEQLHINPSYFGQLFKGETGQLFTNYINMLRIKRAIALMRSTNLRLAEISEQIGYNNTTYFYKIFKRMVGKSPSEYKAELDNR